MDMTGEYRIPAPREAVWKALNDPDVLKQCIPGCEELEKKSDTEFAAKVTAKVGPVKAKFGGNVTMSDLDPPNGYTISGEGSGGAAGFAKGGAKVALADDGGATVLSYTVNATVGGKLAQIGSRLIDSTAKKMANDFFGKFAEIVGGDGAAAAPDAPAAPSAEAPPTAGATAAIEAGRATTSQPEPAATKGLPITVWVVGVIVALGILMWLFQS
ncbi:MAG: SRPBCC family protein [Alphaproteobacteria bacterium]